MQRMHVISLHPMYHFLRFMPDGSVLVHTTIEYCIRHCIRLSDTGEQTKDLGVIMIKVYNISNGREIQNILVLLLLCPTCNTCIYMQNE